MRISDWSSDVCSSDLTGTRRPAIGRNKFAVERHEPLLHQPALECSENNILGHGASIRKSTAAAHGNATCLPAHATRYVTFPIHASLPSVTTSHGSTGPRSRRGTSACGPRAYTEPHRISPTTSLRGTGTKTSTH